VRSKIILWGKINTEVFKVKWYISFTKFIFMNKNHFLVIVFFIISCSPSEQENKIPEKTKEKCDYKAELIGAKQDGTIQNFYFLISTPDTSNSQLEKIAKELKEKNCTIKCNIDLYDDKQAYLLSLEKDSIDISWNVQLSQNEITLKQYKERFDEWNKKNYCHMANHHLGRFTYDNYFWSYILKDSKYKELLCK
jgi:hypothetical protein